MAYFSNDCENEDEYLDEAEKLTRELLEVDDFELEDIFWGEPPNKKKFIKTCKNILKNIDRVKAIPFEKRKFDF